MINGRNKEENDSQHQAEINQLMFITKPTIQKYYNAKSNLNHMFTMLVCWKTNTVILGTEMSNPQWPLSSQKQSQLFQQELQKIPIEYEH